MEMTDGQTDKLNSILQYLSQEQLEDLLIHDFSADGKEPLDESLIIEILEVIREREKGTPKEIKADPSQAWQLFKDQRDTFSPDLPVETPQYFDNHFVAPSPQKRHQKKRRKLRNIIAAAAAVALLSSAMVAQAFGFDAFQSFVQWTADVFSFSAPIEEPTNDIFHDLQDAILSYATVTQVVPTWAPEGYTAEPVSVTMFPDSARIFQRFTNESAWFGIRISTRETDVETIGLPGSYEKDGAQVEEYTVAGTTHFIMSNNNISTVMWIKDNLECAIHGNLPVDGFKKMIDSIYGG